MPAGILYGSTMLPRLFSVLFFTFLMLFAVAGGMAPGRAAVPAYGFGADAGDRYSADTDGQASLRGPSCRLHHFSTCHTACRQPFMRSAGQRGVTSSKKRGFAALPERFALHFALIYPDPGAWRPSSFYASRLAQTGSPYTGHRARTGRQLN